ncbi:membrane-anchored junction protein isoform X2 [Equus przewalskii]|uniref:Membrane-anchored junction protein isoform X2 n=1 Tax=Equus przewalskii TaxID=9798 RepID=A0ABM4K018_EQUPR
MSLKPFTYPFPETRFLHAGPNVYKFKIRYGNSIRGEEIQDKEVIVQELEDSIRVVLGNLDNLQPFATEHFVVFPYKSRWERVAHLKFKHGEIVLVPYPFVFTLYVEMKWIHEDLSPGKPVNDCPLGLVLPKRTAAGAMLRKRKRGQVPSSPGRPGLDRAKMGTSSQDSSKKKPPMETRRLLPILLFLLRKTGPELTSVPIFLYFICGTPATAWLAKRCHVRTQDPNQRTPGRRRRTCELNHCATGPALEFSL